jgi:hypothetical protein
VKLWQHFYWKSGKKSRQKIAIVPKSNVQCVTIGQKVAAGGAHLPLEHALIASEI